MLQVNLLCSYLSLSFLKLYIIVLVVIDNYEFDWE